MVEAASLGRICCKISGENLADLDFFSKSDPVCIVEKKEGNSWVVKGQTERILNDLNPAFETQPEFEYESEQQTMKFTMWDHDGGNDFELIGSVETKVSAILEHIGNGTEYVKDLKHIQKPNKERGKIKITFT